MTSLSSSVSFPVAGSIEQRAEQRPPLRGRDGLKSSVLAGLHGRGGLLAQKIQFVHFLPVDDIEEGVDILGAAVLVFEIVGVLPDVDPDKRHFALSKG